MDDRNWSGPHGHSNWHSRIQLERNRSSWQNAFGVLTVLGILVSAGFELASVSLYTPGLATLTRPLHALLGLYGLMWVLFGLRSGRIALTLWVVTAIPVLGFDRSLELVKPLLGLQLTYIDHYQLTTRGNLPFTTGYRAYGVNFGAILAGAWFLVMARWDALPFSRNRMAELWARWILLLGGIGLGALALAVAGFAVWLFSAPYVILATEPGMSFYHQKEKLGSRYLRVTPALMDKLGLDGSLPPSQWSVNEANPSAWNFAIFVDDGTCPKFARKQINIQTDRTAPELLRQQTPWGERISPHRMYGTNDKGRLRFYGLGRNLDSHITLTPPSEPVAAGEPFKVWVDIDSRQSLPAFKDIDLSYVFSPFSWSTPDTSGYTGVTDTFIMAEDPEGVGEERGAGNIQGTITVRAPTRPGLYSLLVEALDKSTPVGGSGANLGYSSYVMIRVVPASSVATSGE
ncbi:hypothetical protein H5P28_07650 [Ruficoccus amylovorans]|uniref:Uncharacterized protein n=1 Tax=Ruficoccus amylovorans TaxID=1804625 RepID=A0A842HCC0_9BACT|nr:hypothetical protein [Ruficoccus amylovorans]MBC2594135.1 hypothetical protein [Ruficoccus amylovorans]